MSVFWIVVFALVYLFDALLPAPLSFSEALGPTLEIQALHLGLSFVVIVVTARVAIVLRRPLPEAAVPFFWASTLGWFLLDLAKETLLDPVYEVDQPFLWEGALDLSSYVVGIGVGLTVVWALRWPQRWADELPKKGLRSPARSE